MNEKPTQIRNTVNSMKKFSTKLKSLLIIICALAQVSIFAMDENQPRHRITNLTDNSVRFFLKTINPTVKNKEFIRDITLVPGGFYKLLLPPQVTKTILLFSRYKGIELSAPDYCFMKNEKGITEPFIIFNPPYKEKN